LTIDELIAHTREGIGDVPVTTAAAVAVVVLLLLAIVVRRIRKTGRIAHRLTLLANLVGLGWSAQGMWDTAVHHYHVPRLLAFVLFFLGEALIVSRMLMAHEYRRDRPRRARFIRAVWVIATAMGVVVALGEGLNQAPLRLLVPLGVAYSWYLDLTAEDDPAEKIETSWRLTPRYIGLWMGLLEPSARDAKTIDRDHLIKRLTDLTFAQRWGSKRIGVLTRRQIRLARLMLVADDDAIRERDARVARAAQVMGQDEQDGPAEAATVSTETHPTPLPQPNEPERVPTPEPTPDREPKPVPPAPSDRRRIAAPNVRMVDGVPLAGEALRQHAIDRLLASISPLRPTGMSTEELIESYSPPLGVRTAQGWAAEARKQARAAQARAALNGNAPEGIKVP
jgi:hypothetical protein